MRALVTGACGFAGSHLVEYLVEQGDRVVAVAAPTADAAPLQSVIHDIALYRTDLRDHDGCDALIREHKPDAVFQLAAIAFLPDGEANPSRLFAVNVGGPVNLAKSILKYSPSTRLVFVSSAEVYGIAPEKDMPMTESQPIAPANLYAYSKRFAESLLEDLRSRRGLNFVTCRPFTHIGIRQSEKFAASSFAKQIALIEAGQARPVIRVGDLSAKRDITDVRDMVRAYRMAATNTDSPGPFNLGTGTAVPIQQILDILISFCKVTVTVEVDPARLRPSDIPVYAGSPEAFTKETGWKPEISLTTSLENLLNYWRKLI